MVKKPAEQVAKTASKAVTKSGDAAEKIVKGNADALTESGNASRAAIQELTKAYQELASKNAKNLTAAMQALAAVKSPTEFMELQQRLIKEGVAAAVSDSKHIAQLTTAVFTAAFEPVKRRIEIGAEDHADLGRLQVCADFKDRRCSEPPPRRQTTDPPGKVTRPCDATNAKRGSP